MANNLIAIKAQNKALRILRSRYAKDYAKAEADHKAQGGKYPDKHAMREIRSAHEVEFQELYAVEAEKVGVFTNYARRKRNIKIMREALEKAEQDLTRSTKVRLTPTITH